MSDPALPQRRSSGLPGDSAEDAFLIECISSQDWDAEKLLLQRFLDQRPRWPTSWKRNGLEKLLQASADAGWCLTDSLPRQSPVEDTRNFLGPRLYLWPAAVHSRTRLAVVSSRLSRDLETWTEWFRALRTIVARADDEHLFLVVDGMSTTPFVQRAAELFGKSTLRLAFGRQHASPVQWLKHFLAKTRLPAAQVTPVMYVSPELPVADTVTSQPVTRTSTSDDLVDVSSIAEQDRAAFAIGQRVFALHIRRGGQIHRLVQATLANCQRSDHVRVALGASLLAADVRDELLDAGAIGIAGVPLVDDRPHPPFSSAAPRHHVPQEGFQGRRIERMIYPEMRHATEDDRSTDQDIIPKKRRWIAAEPPRLLLDGHYLTHCTRRRSGPWPGQSNRDYHDDLLLQRPQAAHSALAALTRIVSEKRLCASAEGIPGGMAVVSFTQVPISELAQLRVFRPHRGRWDFEPYGICVELGWLAARGARPVTYRDEQTMRQFSDPCELAWMQRSKSHSAVRADIDWTVEQEWRCVGDVDLSQLSARKGCVFVPTPEDALTIEAFSVWPVFVLPPKE